MKLILLSVSACLPAGRPACRASVAAQVGNPDAIKIFDFDSVEDPRYRKRIKDLGGIGTKIMEKPVIQAPAEVLRKKSEPIKQYNTPDLKGLISDMMDTVIKEDGVGLAAPQINISKRIFIIPEDYAPEIKNLNPKTWLRPKTQTVFINPEIIFYSDVKEETEEGCLSVKGANMYHPTNRSYEVVIRAQNEKGKKFKIRGRGFLARIFQHETDHLNGILFIDRMHEK
ncbi:MAG: peptide deformylase [Candidatus Spechtbacterales bacterium]